MHYRGFHSKRRHRKPNKHDNSHIKQNIQELDSADLTGEAQGEHDEGS